jgi:hypothetical protein
MSDIAIIGDKIVQICFVGAKDFLGVRVSYPGHKIRSALRVAYVSGVHSDARHYSFISQFTT